MSEKKKAPEESKQTTAMTKFPRFERGTQEVEHHLFKLKVAPMTKNMSWVYRAPTLVEIEHTHFFHSINDTTMQPNRFSTPVGGHFHEVKLDVDPVTGEILGAKVGPPVQWVSRKVAGGRMIRRIERVKWERYNENPQEPGINEETGEFESPPPGSNEAQVLTEYDNHTHDLQYLGFEKFNSQTKTELRQRETAKVRGLMTGPASRQPGAMEKLQSGPEADKVRQVLKEGSESTQG